MIDNNEVWAAGSGLQPEALGEVPCQMKRRGRIRSAGVLGH